MTDQPPPTSTPQECEYTGPELFGNSAGRLCRIDKSSCFYYNKPEIVQTCPNYRKQKRR